MTNPQTFRLRFLTVKTKNEKTENYDSGQVRLREKVELKVHTFLFLESETTIRERVIRYTHFLLILWASTHLGNSFVPSRSFGGPNNNLKISVTLGISFKCT